MRNVILCVMGAALLSGCSWAKNVQSSKNRVYFENLYFPARLSTTSDDKQSFTVSVDRIDQGLASAREAGRYEATKYCVATYGKSDVAWVAGPDAPDSELRIVEGRLQFEGRCDV